VEIKIKNSKALPLENAARSDVPLSFIVVPNRVEKPQSAEFVKIARFTELNKLAKPAQPTKSAAEAEVKNLSAFGVFGVFDREMLEDLADKTAKLLSAFDRELKYEMKVKADVVQVQVIDSHDGDKKVIRKIPVDEVIKLIEYLKAQIDDRVDSHVDVRA